MKLIRKALEFALMAVVLDLLTLLDKYNIGTLSIKINQNTEIVECDNIIVKPLIEAKYGLFRVKYYCHTPVETTHVFWRSANRVVY